MQKTIWRDRVNIRTRQGRDVGMIRSEIWTTIINMLTALTDKADNMKDWLCKQRDGNPKKKI